MDPKGADRPHLPALPPQESTYLAWRFWKRKERGVYAASAWANPKGAAKFLGGEPAQTVKRPKGRAPAAKGAGC